MTLAEFNVMVDKRVAWRVLFKVSVIIISGCATIFTIALGPVLVVNTLKNRTDEGERNVARLEEQFKGLTTTVGKLQLGVAEMRSEVKANRSDAAAIKAGVDLLLQQRSASLPTRSAIAPTRRTQ